MKVVITGAGIVSPLGCSIDEVLGGLTANRIGISPSPWWKPTDDHVTHYAPVQGFVASQWMDRTVERGTDFFSQFAIAATAQAVQACGLSDLDPRRTAVVHGTSMGGMRSLMEAQHQCERNGAAAIDRKTMIKIWPNMAASQISMRWDLHGPQLTICTACASSLDAVGVAADLIKAGRSDVALVGGTEGGLTIGGNPEDGEFVPASYYGQAMYGMTTSQPDPKLASLPFDVDRSGIVTGEGSAALILESAEHAEARGATILAEVAGYSSLADSYHPSSPDPTGRWEAEVMLAALAAAGVDSDEVGAVFAHATATPKGDEAEIQAINRVYGKRGEPVPVTSLKGHLGHTGASSGAMASIAAIHTLRSGILPNVAGTTKPDPLAEFKVVTEAPISLDARVAQINAFGFGGQNSSIILRRWES